jgi:ABC-type nitrate/sulfonate/bicarbonate transport system substrate-binding protein
LHGLPITVVANGVLWDPKHNDTLYFVAADSQIKTAADLNGKVACVTALGDLNQLGIFAWMDKNGGDFSSLKLVEIPNAGAAEAVIRHRVDVCAVYEPVLTEAREDGRLRLFADCYEAIAPRWVETFYFANENWAAKNPDAVRRWVRATYQAVAYTNSHRSEVEPLFAEASGMSLDTIRKIQWLIGATSSEPALIQPAVDAAAKYKSISRAFPAKELFAPT